jgi:hypothetical protein
MKQLGIGDRRLAAKLWIRVDLNAFLAKKFPGCEVERGISIALLDVLTFVDDLE